MPASAQAADLHSKKVAWERSLSVPFFIITMTMKTATTIDEQIEKLKGRGLQIDNEKKAAEVLADIGYYRLGFYWFPFEKGYPNKRRRTHIFTAGAKFVDAVSLYYFDNDLRNILAPYLHRIEVSLRKHPLSF